MLMAIGFTGDGTPYKVVSHQFGKSVIGAVG